VARNHRIAPSHLPPTVRCHLGLGGDAMWRSNANGSGWGPKAIVGAPAAHGCDASASRCDPSCRSVSSGRAHNKEANNANATIAPQQHTHVDQNDGDSTSRCSSEWHGISPWWLCSPWPGKPHRAIFWSATNRGTQPAQSDGSRPVCAGRQHRSGDWWELEGETWVRPILQGFRSLRLAVALDKSHAAHPAG